MKPSRFLPVAVGLSLSLSLGLLGCGADAGDHSAATQEEIGAVKPIPYVLQYVGTYENAHAARGDIASLTLARNGRYTARFAGSSRLEHGVFYGPSRPAPWPLVLRLVTTGHSFTATEGATGADWGVMRVTRNGIDVDLAPHGASPGESNCDDSGGAWHDDDADPATGLFCTCDAPKVYIPSEGGCVL